MDKLDETASDALPSPSTPQHTTGVQESTSKSSVISTDMDQLKYFSGNPNIEKTTGVLHFYRNKSAFDIMSENCSTLCIFEIPGHVTCSELVRFISPVANKIVESKLVRDSSPNQYFVIVKFKTPGDAFSFYQEYNGLRFNSLENAVCRLIFVERIETSAEDSRANFTVDGSTDLPTCAVCLEKMDESVLTILCNHTFHSDCLQQWEDSTCPVCRFGQTPELIPDQACSECGRTTDLWMCLICGNIGCGRYADAHAYHHFEKTSHTFTKSLGQDLVWDYVADNFVHRLIQGSIDGKMVELQGIKTISEKSEESEANELEVAQLFSSQMETQRQFFEQKICELKDSYSTLEQSTELRIRELEHQLSFANNACENLQKQLETVTTEKLQLGKKAQKSQQIIRKLQADIDEEKQLSKVLLEDKMTLTQKYAELEKQKAEEKSDLEDQISDLMKHFELQAKLSDELSKANVTAEELQTGNVVVEKSQQSKRKAKRNK